MYVLVLYVDLDDLPRRRCGTAEKFPAEVHLPIAHDLSVQFVESKQLCRNMALALALRLSEKGIVLYSQNPVAQYSTILVCPPVRSKLYSTSR